MYRAINHAEQSLEQLPVGWCRQQNAFMALERDPDPKTALALQRASTPYVAKVWTELAYESTRRRVAPEAVSRLDALYCVSDPLDALSFTEFSRSAHAVHRGVVREGVPWQLVDMSEFEIVVPQGDDAEAWAEAWNTASRGAEQYWSFSDADSGSDHFVGEILVGGPVDLDSVSIKLIPTLRRLGLVE